MRIGLALAVVITHGAITTGGQAADSHLWVTPLRPVLRAVLPMFFALSGFLVAGSLERCRTLISFLGLRVIRIYPALIIEVLLSAFIIGLSITTLPAKAYLTDPEFHRYLLNVTGDIHYLLPGVFADNPFPNTVNSQLWTVPYELGCYITISALALIGVVRRPWLAPLAALGICVLHLGYRVIEHHGQSLYMLGGIPGTLLIVSFLVGISLYLYREQMSWDGRLFGGSVILAALLLTYLPGGEYPAVFLLGYVTVWLGLTDYRRLAIIRSADLSYGVYLYGFVIQQLFAFLFPEFRYWWASVLVCIPCSLLFAAASWNLIEKPALKLRRPLMKLEAFLFPASGQRFWQKGVPLTDGAAKRDI
ncbi:acyltransferase family protein [Acidisoma silvae]|uniref:acyltransferase family protein n=1 Tax=Acidisoma silvae TaxID=2802396 RepID=UPI001D0A0706|nr:acyltransferase [Acidisoma silvae]